MRSGYKNTEIGYIPDEWELVSLYNLRNPEDKYSFTGGPFGSDLKSEHYTEDGVPIVQLQNIGEGTFKDNKDTIFTSESKADQLKSCNIYPGEIVLAKMAPVARSCKIPSSYPRYLMCSDGIRLAVDLKQFDNEYVYQSLNAPYFLAQAEAKSTGTTRARIGLKDLKQIPIAVPPLSEQRIIADILSTVDEKREVIDQQILETEELKKGLMQVMLTKGIGHTQFKDSPLGEIPKSWKAVPLKNIGAIVTGSTPKTKNIGYYSDEGFLWATPGDLGPHKYITSTMKKLTSLGFEQTRKLPSKSILVTCIGSTIGKIGMSDSPIATNQQINSVVCNPENDPEFYYYVLEYMGPYIKSVAGTQAVPLLNKTDFSNLLVPQPPLKEQCRITSTLTELDNKKSVLGEKRECYEILKKGLMQQLLTGRIRVINLVEA